MFRFLRIERPTTATLRPVCTATSIACCIRWTFEAKEATRIRPGPLRDDLAERLADQPLGAGEARAARRSSSRRAAGRRRGCPISASRPTSVRKPSTGVWSSFQSLVCRTRHAGGLDHDRHVVRHRVRHAHELEPERADLDRPALGLDLAQLGRVQQAVLVELRLDEAERQARRPDLAAPPPRASGTAARRRDPRAHA